MNVNPLMPRLPPQVFNPYTNDPARDTFACRMADRAGFQAGNNRSDTENKMPITTKKIAILVIGIALGASLGFILGRHLNKVLNTKETAQSSFLSTFGSPFFGALLCTHLFVKIFSDPTTPPPLTKSELYRSILSDQNSESSASKLVEEIISGDIFSVFSSYTATRTGDSKSKEVIDDRMDTATIFLQEIARFASHRAIRASNYPAKSVHLYPFLGLNLQQTPFCNHLLSGSVDNPNSYEPSGLENSIWQDEIKQGRSKGFLQYLCSRLLTGEVYDWYLQDLLHILVHNHGTNNVNVNRIAERLLERTTMPGTRCETTHRTCITFCVLFGSNHDYSRRSMETLLGQLEQEQNFYIVQTIFHQMLPFLSDKGNPYLERIAIHYYKTLKIDTNGSGYRFITILFNHLLICHDILGENHEVVKKMLNRLTSPEKRLGQFTTILWLVSSSAKKDNTFFKEMCMEIEKHVVDRVTTSNSTRELISWANSITLPKFNNIFDRIQNLVLQKIETMSKDQDPLELDWAFLSIFCKADKSSFSTKLDTFYFLACTYTDVNKLWISTIIMEEILGFRHEHVRELAKRLFMEAKTCPDGNLLSQCVELITRIFGQEHEYTQELLWIAISTQQNPKAETPIAHFQNLLAKASVDVWHNSRSITIDGTAYKINPEWIAKPVEVYDIPFTYDQFLELVHDVEDKIKSNPGASDHYLAITEQMSFDKLKTDISEDFYSKHLDRSSRSNQTSSSSSSCPASSSSGPVNTTTSSTSFRLRFILEYIRALKEKSQTTEDLTDADLSLIQLLLNVRNCRQGKNTGVDISYYSMAKDSLYSESEAQNKATLDRIFDFLHEQLRRLRMVQITSPGMHARQLLLTLIGREIGLMMKGEKPCFDFYIKEIPQKYLDMSKQQGLDEFYEQYTPQKLVQWIQNLFVENIKIGEDAYEKWIMVSQTLNNTQEGDLSALVMDPRFIKFKKPIPKNDPSAHITFEEAPFGVETRPIPNPFGANENVIEDDEISIPIGIKKRAAVEILKSMGVLIEE